MFVELGCLCKMCIYFDLINQLDPVVHFRNVEVFITFFNFECTNAVRFVTVCAA